MLAVSASARLVISVFVLMAVTAEVETFVSLVVFFKYILKRHVVVLIKYYLTIKQSAQQLFYISEISH
jgi:hypothetical protein